MRTYITSGLVLIVVAVIFVFSYNTPSQNINVSQNLSTGQDQPALVSSNISVGKAQTLTWVKSQYPSQYVSVRLLKKVSSNPVSYDLARIISTKTANTGSIKWTPSSSDVGTNLLIEVSCVDAPSACSAGYQPIEAVLK